jgi:myosin heavy subunit
MNMKTNRKKTAFIPVVLPLIMIASMVITGGSCKSKTAQNSGDISREDVQEEVEEAVDTTVAFLTEERKEMMDTYQSKVETAEQQIQEMKEQLESTEAAVKQDYQQKIQMLESQTAFIKNNIQELRESSAEAWKQLSAGVDTALVDLEKALRDARKEFQDS